MASGPAGGPSSPPEAALTVRFRILAAALLAALPAPACGRGPAAPPVPPKVEWNPEDLRPRPGELVEAPGSGTAFLEGVVVDVEGRPVPGATVEMHAAPKGEVPAVPLLHARAAAGPDGSFRVGPGPSPWWVHGLLSAHAPGFARTALRSSAKTLPGQPVADEGTPARIVLRPGIPVRGTVRGKDGGAPDGAVTLWAIGTLNFFELATTDPLGNFSFLAPGGPVDIHLVGGVHPRGRAFLDVRPGGENVIDFAVDRGRDIRGRVVEQATGKPIPGSLVRGFYGETRLVTADANGEFLLPRYWFRAFQVRSPGYAVRTHQLAVVSGTPGAPPEEVRLVPGLVARGRVTDLEGRPVAGARLKTFVRDAAGEFADIAGGISRPDGTFTFVGLPLPVEGREVRVFGLAPGFAYGGSEPLRGGPMEVVDGVEVRLPRLADVEGRVEDEKGGPFASGVSVEWDLAPGLEPYRGIVPATGSTFAGTDGRWRARVPEGSRVRARSSDEGFGEGSGEGVTPGPVVVKVFRGLSVRGSVRDAQGNVVRRGDVRVEPSPPTDPRPSRDAVVHGDGTFEAGGLRPGAYDLSVLVHPEFLQQVVRGLEAGGPPVEVTLRRAGSLRGRVVLPPEAPKGQSAEISLRGLEDTHPLPSGFAARVAGGDKSFAFGPLSPGPYALSAVAGDWRIDLDRVIVPEKEPLDLGDLQAVLGGAAGGLVTAGGRPLGGAPVEVFRVLPDGRLGSVAQVPTWSDGRWRAGGLRPGPHVVAVRPRDRPQAEARFEAVPGQVAALDIDVPAGARLAVKVLDAEGRPAAGARITVAAGGSGVPFWREGSPAPGPHVTGPDGTLPCSGLPAGDLRVTADLPGKGTGEALVSVAEGAGASVEIRLGR